MKFIADMRESDNIIGHYFCKAKQSLKTKTGKTYYSITLQDKTGTAEGKVWDFSQYREEFEGKYCIFQLIGKREHEDNNTDSYIQFFDWCDYEFICEKADSANDT